MRRLYIALAALALLALLAWQTISDDKLRLVTLVILGGFALRSVFQRHRTMRGGPEQDSEEGR